MKILVLTIFIVLFSTLRASPAFQADGDLVDCLYFSSQSSTLIQKAVYTPKHPLYYTNLNFSIQNLRYASATTPKPQAIIAPLHLLHVKAAIYCARKHGLEVRVRSGGHDFEGQSYVADVPFVVIDLLNLHSITVDVETSTAWAEAGATQGELYYTIANTSRTLAFPGGEYPTVGIGGFISGGGYGMLQRKYGLAADNVVDALIMDVNGNIWDRESMGEDLFWAIRGGGGGNFGVILAWKLKLVTVPEKVTVFKITRTLEENAIELLHRWQYVAHKFPEDLFVRAGIGAVKSTEDGEALVNASFESLFLGGVDRLLQVMDKRFPELGLVKEDCIEMSWIESVCNFDGSPSLDSLLDRYYAGKTCNKFKGDYVKEPISIKGIKGLCKLFAEQDWVGVAAMAWSPYGGRMSKIPESSIPYPHRAGNLFFIFQAAMWNDEQINASLKALDWMTKLYSYMRTYASKSPRGAYVNYRDLDLGVTKKYTTPEEARIWGVQYFKNNYDRLVQVKTKVDPGNFFRNEQSIPPLFPSSREKGNARILKLEDV